MPWKMAEDGNNLFKDESGNPVWVTDANEERAVDYPAMSAKLASTTKEAVERKNKLRELESRFSAVEDIEDLSGFLDEAKKAIEMVKNAPDAQKTIEEQVALRLQPKEEAWGKREASLLEKINEQSALNQKMAVESAFARSSYVTEKLVSPSLAMDLFANRFKLSDDGQLVGYGEDGKEIYGESGLASFDEALAKMVESRPDKGVLLKGSTATGSGAQPSAGGGSSVTSVKQLKTSADKAKYIAEHGLEKFKSLSPE